MEIFAGDRGSVDPVQPDRAGIRFIKAHQQVDQRCFSCTGRADNGDFLARICLGREVVNDGFLRCVAETDMAEFHLACCGFDRVLLVAFVLHFLGLQHIKYALRGSRCGLERCCNSAQTVERIGEQPHIDDKCDHCAEGDVPLHRHHSANHANGQIAEVPHKDHDGIHQAGIKLRLPYRVKQPIVHFAEVLDHTLLAAEGFHSLVAGILLLDVSIQGAQKLLPFIEIFLRNTDDQRHRAKANECGYNGYCGKGQIGQKHHHQRADKSDHAGNEHDHHFVERHSNGIHIVCNAAQYISDGCTVEITKGQSADLAVDIRPHILRNPLTNRGHDISLNIAEDQIQHIDHSQNDRNSGHGGDVDPALKPAQDDIRHLSKIIRPHYGSNAAARSTEQCSYDPERISPDILHELLNAFPWIARLFCGKFLIKHG